MVSPQEVNEFHQASDKDTSPYAHHHTLGKSANQAAPGNHDHPHDHDFQYLKLDNLAVRSGRLASNFGVGTAAWVDVKTIPLENNIGDGISDLGNNYYRLDKGGIYVFSVQLGFSPNSTGTLRACRIVLARSPSTIILSRNNGTNNYPYEGNANCTWTGLSLAGDVINFQCYQDSGVSLNLTPLEGQTNFSITRLKTV